MIELTLLDDTKILFFVHAIQSVKGDGTNTRIFVDGHCYTVKESYNEIKYLFMPKAMPDPIKF